MILTGNAEQLLSTEESAADDSGNMYLSSYHGLGKGYRFFKDGHVQGIQYHPLPDSPGLCYVCAKVFNIFGQVMPDCKWLCAHYILCLPCWFGGLLQPHCSTPIHTGGICTTWSMRVE